MNGMARRIVTVAALWAGGVAIAVAQPAPYYPGAAPNWERRSPAAVGMDSIALRQAIAYALANPSGLLRAQTVEEAIATQERGLAASNEPDPKVIGPMMVHKNVNGLVIRRGYIVAEFGDTKFVDLTASLTKSILSLTAGVTFDQGLIRHLDDRVGESIRDGGFDSPHNAKITWRQLLQQTSEWEGTLWGKPDLNDRRTRRGKPHNLGEPGTFWDYNDVRVNRLALALLRLWQQPLPQVLAEHIMTPIGATPTWEWHGYDNSWVKIRGVNVQSVSGGAHWGGGFWVSAEDLGRIGLLFLRNGKWNDRQLLSPEWIRMSVTPTEIRRDYGFLWWLNTDHRFSKRSPTSSYAMRGGGGFYCWIDPVNELVIVVKALGGDLGQFVDLITASIVQ